MEKTGCIEIQVTTQVQSEFVDVTKLVQDAVTQSRLIDGTIIVFCPHTTAGMTINESADPAVRRDMLVALERLVHSVGDYQHQEGNSPAHIKTSMMGSSVMVRVEDGRLWLGTWQGIYLAEFDGPRERRIWVWKV